MKSTHTHIYTRTFTVTYTYTRVRIHKHACKWLQLQHTHARIHTHANIKGGDKKNQATIVLYILEGYGLIHGSLRMYESAFMDMEQLSCIE